MAKPSFFVVTSPSITDTGIRSFRFIFASNAPRHAVSGERGSRFGYVILRERGTNEIDPFKLARGEPGAVGPNGIKRWDINIFGTRGIELADSVDEELPNEAGLQELVADAPSAILLMARDVFDRFKVACDAQNIETLVHHFDGPLATS